MVPCKLLPSEDPVLAFLSSGRQPDPPVCVQFRQVPVYPVSLDIGRPAVR